MQLQRNDELGQLARDINELASTLAHNDTVRKRWLADTSHELRTPISILKGELEAMLDGVRPVNKAGIQSLHHETLQLQKLVEDLHELNNADIGGLRYYKQSVDLVALLEEQLQRHRPVFDNAGLQLQLSNHPKILNAWVDSSRLHQLLDNLLNNSLKYTTCPGKVQIKLQQQGNNALLVISDSAPGVPDAALDKLFEHLYRVDNSRNRLTGGSGLGLAICRRIVEGHHGTITASHSELGGITITITLPLNQ
jgi:two-component system sensor histidine kinase BaeS